MERVITPPAKAGGFSLSGSPASATLSRRASRDWVPTLYNPRAVLLVRLGELVPDCTKVGLV
jgi:hypothetical protein